MTTANTSPDLSAGRRSDQMIRYPRFRALHTDIRTCQELSQLTGEAHCMSLEGPPGAGKSTLVGDYAAFFPPEDRADGTYVPVFYIEMPSPATIKGTASKLLERLGDPAAYRGTALLRLGGNSVKSAKDDVSTPFRSGQRSSAG